MATAPLITRLTGLGTTVQLRARAVGRLHGVVSKVRMTRKAAEALTARIDEKPPAGTAVAVRVRDLDDRLVWLRPRSHDRAVLEFLFEDYHLPPPEIAGGISRIAVFGANIGLSLADLALRHPGAQLLAVEADPDNAELARHNLAHVGNRCRVVQAAVRHRDDTLELHWDHNAWGYQLAPEGTPAPVGAGAVSLDATDAATILDDFRGDDPVDYLLINIETAWYPMLQYGAWTKNVRCIRIEIEDHHDEAVPLLEGLGYRAHLERVGWGVFAVGIRP
jgi:FkbM family methyltransferase